MSKDEALAIAKKAGKEAQVAFFIVWLGMPPREALIRVGIKF